MLRIVAPPVRHQESVEPAALSVFHMSRSASLEWQVNASQHRKLGQNPNFPSRQPFKTIEAIQMLSGTEWRPDGENEAWTLPNVRCLSMYSRANLTHHIGFSVLLMLGCAASTIVQPQATASNADSSTGGIIRGRVV